MRLIKHKNEDTNSSFRIVSVYDMLRFYLDKLIQTLDELPDVINNSISNDTITRREMIVFYIKELQSVSSLFGLKVSATQAAKIIDMLEENIPLDIDMLKEIDRLKEEMTIETQSMIFYAIPDTMIEYHSNFTSWNDIETYFNSDIDEAGKCLSLGRYKASVFHLMRIIKKGVQLIASHFNIESVNEKCWGPLIREINSKVTTSKMSPEQKKEYHTSCSHLNDIRLVWRNNVMHPKDTYTEEEAIKVYLAVKTLVQFLLKTILK